MKYGLTEVITDHYRQASTIISGPYRSGVGFWDILVRDGVRIRVSIMDAKYGQSTTHFDDPQTQTVDKSI